MDTSAFNTDASAHRIDTLVEGLDSYFRTLTRDAGNVLNGDQAFLHFRHFLLEETLQEQRRCTREDDLRRLVFVIHLNHYGADDLTFAIEIGRNLILLRQVEFITFFVEQQHLFLPNLIEFTGNNLADHLFVLLVEALFLELQDLRSQRLTKVQNHTTTEGSHVHFVGYFLTYFGFVIELERIAERNLGVRIRHIIIFHHQTVTIYLKVTFVRVYNHVIVSSRAVHLRDHAGERVFEHVDKSLLVNAFEFVEFLENVNKIN